jgi:hypothetical protein
VGVVLVASLAIGFSWLSASDWGVPAEPSTHPTTGLDLGVGGATLFQPTEAEPGCALDHYCYGLAFTSVSPGVTGGSITLQVTTSSGTVYRVTGPGSAEIIEIDGVTIVVGATIATATAFVVGNWTSGNPTTQLLTSDTLWLDLGTGPDPAGTGLTLVIFGTGSYSGSESVALP